MSALRCPDLLTVAGWLAVFAPMGMILGKAVPDVTLSLTAILFLVHSAQSRDFSWARKPWVFILLSVWAYGVARSAFAEVTPNAVSWIRFVIFTAALAEWILPYKIWRDRLVLSIIGMTSVLALDGLFQFIVGVDILGRPMYATRLTAFFYMPKVGLILSWFFLPALVWLWESRRRAFAAAYGVLCLTVILLSGDRFALLYALSLLALLPLFAASLRKQALIWGTGVAVIGFAVLFYFPDVRARQFDSIIQMISDIPATRYGMIWMNVLDIFKAYPIFGIGISQYAVVCPNPIFGPEYIGPLHDKARCVAHPHNMMLQLLLEFGLVGFAGFCAFFVAAGRRIVLALRSSGHASVILLALALVIALRLFPLASSPSIYTAWVAMPFWLMIGWALAIAENLERDNPSRS